MCANIGDCFNNTVCWSYEKMNKAPVVARYLASFFFLLNEFNNLVECTNVLSM